jgi:hypothetical protein
MCDKTEVLLLSLLLMTNNGRMQTSHNKVVKQLFELTTQRKRKRRKNSIKLLMKFVWVQKLDGNIFWSVRWTGNRCDLWRFFRQRFCVYRGKFTDMNREWFSISFITLWTSSSPFCVGAQCAFHSPCVLFVQVESLLSFTAFFLKKGQEST